MYLNTVYNQHPQPFQPSFFSGQGGGGGGDGLRTPRPLGRGL